MTLALYGHPFSSYTWKAQIALHAADLAYELRMVDGDHPENAAFIAAHAGPWGKFPVLVDGEDVLFEATTIIEHLASRHPGAEALLPTGRDAAIATRMLDRVFDNYVMAPTQNAVDEALRPPGARDPGRSDAARERLERSYRWLEEWLPHYPAEGGQVTLIECAAAPSLFYADWVREIDGTWPRLRAWRQWLNHLPPVARCIEAARPYRPFFPLGAPDRD